MTLPRKELRDAAKAALKTIPGLTVTGPHAFLRGVAGMPSAEVVVSQETTSRLSMDGDLERRIRLFVVLHGTGADVDDVLDDLAEKVEAALYGSAAIMALVGSSDAFDATGAQFEIPEEGSDRPVARLHLSFEATVYSES